MSAPNTPQDSGKTDGANPVVNEAAGAPQTSTSTPDRAQAPGYTPTASSTAAANDMETDVDMALVDVLEVLAKEKVRLSDEGRAEIVRIFNGNLGLYLNTIGSEHPTRDVWKDWSTRRLRNFIRRNIMEPIAEKAHKDAGTNGQRPTPPLGRAQIFEAVRYVATNASVKQDCQEMIDKLANDLDAKAVGTPICTEFFMMV